MLIHSKIKHPLPTIPTISKTYHEFGEFERFESFEFDPLEFLHSLFSVRLVADDRVDDRVNIVDVSALCVLTLSSSA